MQPESWIESHCWVPTAEQGRRLAQQVVDQGLRLGIVFPASDAASSLGKHLLALRHGWPGGVSPWCEISVVDLGSLDATVEIARSQDARILHGSGRIIAGEAPAEGLALARAIEQLGCDLVVVVPAGLRRIDWDLVSGLALALMNNPEAAIAIGYEPEPSLISRLSIRPLLSALQEELVFLMDPACPLLAVRTAKLRGIPIAGTLGYESALLMDIHRVYGLEGIMQVPVGKLFWSGEERRFLEAAAFRSILALLESGKRGAALLRHAEFGHIFSTISVSDAGLSQSKAQLQIFDWISC